MREIVQWCCFLFWTSVNIVSVTECCYPCYWNGFGIMFGKSLNVEVLKMEFRSKYKKIHIHWYFIATKYLIWNNAFVGYIDIWTRVYSLVTIYLNNQNNSYRVSRKRVWYLWAIWKYNYQWCVGFFLPHSPQIPLKKAFIYNILMLIS